MEVIGRLEKKLEIVKVWRKLRVEGKKENRRRKRKWKREIILLEEKMKIKKVADSRDSVTDAEIFREKYRNRPKFKYLGTTRNNYQKSRI